MSSSNAVRIPFIVETDYGVTPGSGNFKTARFTSEALSGSPNTVESQQIRTDRMSSGQIVVGIDVGGAVPFELAKEAAIDDFLSSAMLSDWDVQSTVTTALTLDATALTLTRTSGSFITDGIKKGDFITLGGFTASGNNVQVMVTADPIALVANIVGPSTLVTGTGTTTTYKRLDKLVIGTTKKSFSMEKEFTDLTDKAINYRGMLVSQMDLSVAFGALITGSFTFVGNDQEVVSDSADFMTDGRTVTPPSTAPSMNGSIDMPFLASNAIGAFEAGDLELQSVSISLNNNMSAQNVIGRIAPLDYSAGTAQIQVNLSAYLRDEAWDILPKKLTQDPFSLGFIVRNSSGGYGFFMHAVQVSFDDPSSGGQNQDITLDMQGTAKVGPNGESALAIYRF